MKNSFAQSSLELSKAFCYVIVIFLLASCTVTKLAPITDITIGGAPTITSSKSATISFQSGEIDGTTTYMYMGGPGIPVGKNPEFFFNQIDQKQFAATLRSELLRLAVIGSAPQMTANSKADLDIKVAFHKTFHKVTFHEYTLEVTVSIHGGKEPIVKVYKINSNEGATASEMWNTNPYQGKAKAIRKLLEKTIPDIQAYVGANP